MTNARAIVSTVWIAAFCISLCGCIHPHRAEDADSFPLPVPNEPVPASRADDLDFARRANAPNGAAYEVGLATWYGQSFAGHKTASGERFDPRGMTAAHKSLPIGTWVEVRRVDTGTSIRVRINDRGPYGDARRIIDLSQRAADALGVIPIGVAHVELRIVRGPD